MKRTILPLLLVAALCLAVSGPAAAIPIPYAGIHGSYTLLEDESAGVLTNIDFNEGFGVGAFFGFDFAHEYGNARLETEFTFRRNKVGGLNLQGVRSARDAGSATSQCLMANGYYVFENLTRLKPYIMGGLGAARVSLNNIEFNRVDVVDDDEFQVAYQGGAGVDLKLSRRLALDLGYRFFRIANVTLSDETGTPFDFAYKAHNLNLGLKYSFH